MSLTAIVDDNYMRHRFNWLSKRTQNGLLGKTKQVKSIGVTSKHGVLQDKKMGARWSVRERTRIWMKMVGKLALMFNKDMAKIVHPLYTLQYRPLSPIKLLKKKCRCKKLNQTITS